MFVYSNSYAAVPLQKRRVVFVVLIIGVQLGSYLALDAGSIQLLAALSVALIVIGLLSLLQSLYALTHPHRFMQKWTEFVSKDFSDRPNTLIAFLFPLVQVLMLLASLGATLSLLNRASPGLLFGASPAPALACDELVLQSFINTLTYDLKPLDIVPLQFGNSAFDLFAHGVTNAFTVVVIGGLLWAWVVAAVIVSTSGIVRVTETGYLAVAKWTAPKGEEPEPKRCHQCNALHCTAHTVTDAVRANYSRGEIFGKVVKTHLKGPVDAGSQKPREKSDA